MSSPQMVMYEEEFHQIQAITDRLARDSKARFVVVIDRNGIPLSQAGDSAAVDIASFAPLVAGTVAAAGGIAQLLKENEFAAQFHEGERATIYKQLIGKHAILAVVFDMTSTIGFVRLYSKKACAQLVTIFETLERKAADPNANSILDDITDDDIDNLFNDSGTRS